MMRAIVWRSAGSILLLLVLLLSPAALLAQTPDPSPTPAPSVAPAEAGSPAEPAGPSAVAWDGGAAPDAAAPDAGAPDAAPAGGTPPVVTLKLPPATRSLTVKVKLPTTDPGGSGIKGWYLSENPATPGLGASGWKTFKPPTFKLSSGQGTKTVYAWARTRDGAISARASDTLTFDTTVPTVSLSAPSASATRSIAVTITGEDPLSAGTHPASGVVRWAIVAGTSAPSSAATAWKTAAPTTFKLPTGNGTKTISAFTRDAAGNVSVRATATVALGVAQPIVTFTMPAATAKRAVPVTLSATDPGGTGIAGHHLSLDPTPPLPSATWATRPTTFTVPAGDGPKTVHAWVKDRNGTISPRAQAATLLDQARPTVTMTAPATATSITLPVTITGTDPGANASGIAAWAVVSGTSAPTGGGSWKADPPTSVTLPYGNGTKTISAFTRDAAGNVSLAATRTLTMTIATPSLTLSLPQYTRDARVTVSLTADDPGGTGIAGYYLSESPTTPAANAQGWIIRPTTTQLALVQGSHTVHAWVKDANGSVSARRQADTFLDTILPETTFSAPFASRLTAITIAVSGDDSGGSGITHYAVRTSSSPPGSTSSEWVAVAPTGFTLSGADGTRTLRAWTRDAAGNVSPVAVRGVILDTAAPGATIAAPSATPVRPITLTLGGSDGSGSGITHWAVVQGTSAPVAGDAAWVTAPPTGLTVTAGDGSKTLSAFTRDAAGNVSAAASTAVLLDTTAPSISLNAPSWTNSTSPWVALDGSDGAGSGITHWAVVAGTTQPGPGSGAWSTAKPSNVAVATGDGSKTVSAWSRDAVGNVSAIATRTTQLDTVLPTVSLSGVVSLSSSRTISVTLAGADAASGVNRWALTEQSTPLAWDATEWTGTRPTSFHLSSSDGTKTVRAYTRDTAGNVSLVSTATLTLDRTAPSVTFSTPSVATVRSIALTISGTDGSGSGITHWAVVEGTAQPAAGDAAWQASPTTTWLLPAADGSTAITVFSRDLAGNVGSVTRTVTLDTSAPTATLSAASPSASRTIAVTVTGSDGAVGSGITGWIVVEGSSTPAADHPSWSTSAPTTFVVSAGDGSKTVGAFTRDAAGHVSAAATRTVLLDGTAPTATLSAPATTTAPVIAITVGGGDGAGSGITRWAVVEGGTAPDTLSEAWLVTPPTTFSLSPGTGSRTLSAFTRDAAGNVSLAASTSVELLPGG